MRISSVIGTGALVLALAGVATAAPPKAKPKPWQWTTGQASAAIMRQAEDFYVEETQLGYRMGRDLSATRCRGTGKAVARRFVTFVCTATFQRGAAESPGAVRVNARTRRAGGLCWAAAPTPIPSGCLAPGKRAEGSREEVARLVYRELGTPAQWLSITAHGAGFYSWAWSSGSERRGTVTFSPRPILKVLA